MLVPMLQASNGQGVAMTQSDKVEYGYGEAINISFTLENTSDSAFILNGSSNCQAQFVFDGLDSANHTVCLLDSIDIEFLPGSQRTWRWLIEPNVLGLPDSSGVHTIIGYYPGSAYADTIQVVAPAYLGGRLSVAFDADFPADTVEAIKADLGVTVIESWQFGLGEVNEIWEIEGQTLSDVLRLYGSHPVFRRIEIHRNIQYNRIVDLEDEEILHRFGIESTLYPNPVSGNARIQLRTDAPQLVRLSLYDVLGRQKGLIYEGYITTNDEFVLNSAGLASGVYWYRIETALGVLSKMFVVNN